MSDGLVSALRSWFRRPYNALVRPHLPRRSIEAHGVTVPDAVVILDIGPYSWEDELIEATRQVIRPGDHVVVVGGGNGIYACVAARLVGSEGSVIVFEADADRVDTCQETVKRNDLTDRVTVEHAVVGEAITVDGSVGDATHVAPVALPDCDVLEIDAEGAEMAVLGELYANDGPAPDTVVVEHHGCYAAPRSDVRSLLSNGGYRTADGEWIERERGIGIVIGGRNDRADAVAAARTPPDRSGEDSEHHD